MRRRAFLKTSGAFAAFSIIQLDAAKISPNSRLQVAVIGVNGRGTANLKGLLNLPNVDLVALCDVDSLHMDESALLCPGARQFRDYRVMLEKMEKKIDAVLVSTPDHMHFPMSMAAMEMGKHVYCEKPLAHNVRENRQLANFSKKQKLVTQMGIQRSSALSYQMVVEYVRGGLIGKVSEVHVWSNKDWGSDDLVRPTRADPIPDTLDWNLWLGVAPKFKYQAEIFHPKNWRKLLDFGTGTLGDMGVHIFDTPYRALELSAPNWARASCREPNGFTHPSKVKVEYGFPSTRYTTKELKWTWYDGTYGPPSEIPGITLPEEKQLPEQGALLIGDVGTMIVPHPSGIQTLPMDLIRSVPKPEVTAIDHHGEWVDACLGNGATRSPFSYGGPLCEALQLGVVACRFPGQTLNWNPKSLKIPNLPEANKFLRRKYRKF